MKSHQEYWLSRYAPKASLARDALPMAEVFPKISHIIHRKLAPSLYYTKKQR
jgi:hypothetical protein